MVQIIFVNNVAGFGTLKYVPYFSFNRNCSSPLPSLCSQRDDPVQRVDWLDDDEEAEVVDGDDSVVELVLILAASRTADANPGDDEDGIEGLNLLLPLVLLFGVSLS